MDLIYPLFAYRTLTQAQKAEIVLRRGGIPSSLLRAPDAMSAEGCAYAVRALTDDTDSALRLLRAAGAAPRRVYYPEEDAYKRRRFP